MQLVIDVPPPEARRHEPGTHEFRYWVAAEALERGVSFWSALVPEGTTWQAGSTLTVRLDAGDRLNAFYNRATLSFFHATVAGTTVFTGESPDVIAHELGHAVLDALRPQLWDAMSHEVAALHEAFGDISAILSGLQLPSLRQQVVAETGGLYRASRLSRVAEQLGWAVAQRRPCSPDPDCLRNAVNCFAYQPASQLPALGPSSALSSEPHSYSRVFTGAFFEAFAGMVVTQSRQPTADHLLQASVDAGRLLVAAVRAAPVDPSYFTQVAAHLMEADRLLFGGKYAAALESGLMRRGIVSLATTAAETPSLSAAAAAASGSGGAQEAAELPTLTLNGRDFGLDQPVVVRVAAETPRLAAAPVALHGGPAAPQSAVESARSFVTELLLLDRVKRPNQPDWDPSDSQGRLRTHELIEQDGALFLRRRFFDSDSVC